MAFILFLIFHKRKIQHYRNVAWVNIAKSTHWGSKKTGNTFRWYFQMDLLEKIFIFNFRLRVCVMVQLIKSDHCSQQWLSAERATSHSPYQSGSGHTTPQCVTRPHFFLNTLAYRVLHTVMYHVLYCEYTPSSFGSSTALFVIHRLVYLTVEIPNCFQNCWRIPDGQHTNIGVPCLRLWSTDFTKAVAIVSLSAYRGRMWMNPE